MGYYDGGEIVGVIAMRNDSHISLLFVNKKYHRKGIARQLFESITEEIKQNTSVSEISVNSSPYAVKIYERPGFTATEQEQEKDGIRFVPMKYRLSM